MASSYKDSSPNSGSKAKGGMKNVDGREKGAEWNSDHSQPAPSFKNVGVEPNEGLTKLKQVSGHID
jgi:hypothetical protein